MSKNINELHPRMQEKINELKKLCQSKGLSIEIAECFRTVEEQDALYAKGRTAPGSIVTNAKGTSYNSQHQWGIAADFYRNDGKGAYNEENNFFETVGVIAKSLGLGWGGEWKSLRDLPHLYLPDWGTTPSSLKEKYKVPQAFIKTWSADIAPKPSIISEYTNRDFIKEVQLALKLILDENTGIVLLSKTITISATNNQKHPIVKPLQKYLNSIGYSVGTPDGIAGAKFTSGVKKFQKANDCVSDGIITAKAKTWRKLLRV